MRDVKSITDNRAGIEAGIGAVVSGAAGAATSALTRKNQTDLGDLQAHMIQKSVTQRTAPYGGFWLSGGQSL